MTNYINEVYSLDTGLFYFTLSVHTICIIRHYFNWGNTSTFLMEDIIPSITCTSLFQFCNTITYPNWYIYKEDIGTPHGPLVFFSQWCPMSETWHCASPAPHKIPKTYLQFHARFLLSQMELALLCAFFSMVQFIKYKHSFLIFFFAISDYELNRNTMECLFFFRKIGRIQPNPKGRCPLQGSLPILLNVQIGVSLFKHCRRCCQSNLSAPWRKSRWKNI